MSFNIKIFLFCPIPEGQKPINEYINYKQNFFTTLINSRKKEKLFIKWYLSIFLSIFLLFFLNNFLFSPIKLLFETFFLTNLILFFFYFINFIKWKNLEKRFKESRIIYEEGSWYDSQIWEKPFLLIKNDKLIESQKIQPIIQNIFRNFLLITYINIFSLGIFFFFK
jgi:hypothetical protein